jgi:hypothetical protein
MMKSLSMAMTRSMMSLSMTGRLRRRGRRKRGVVGGFGFEGGDEVGDVLVRMLMGLWGIRANAW